MAQCSDNRCLDVFRSSCILSSFSAIFLARVLFLARSPRVLFFLSRFWYLLGRPSFFFYFDIAHFEFFIEILVMPVADVTVLPFSLTVEKPGTIVDASERKKLTFSMTENNHFDDVIYLLRALKLATDVWEADSYVSITTVYPNLITLQNGMPNPSWYGSSKINNAEPLHRCSMDDDVFLSEMSL